MQPDSPGPERRPSHASLVGRWAQAIAGTSYVPLNRRELRDYLDSLAGRLIGAVRAGEFDPAVPRHVGAAMVAAHFTASESLERTLDILGQELSASPDAMIRDRTLPTLVALAAGYTEALRGRILAEQQGITVAALIAQKDAEDARWASETRFAALFADAAIGISIGTVAGQVLEVNRAMCEMFGYTPEEFMRRSITDFVHPRDAVHTWDVYAELISGARDHFRMEKPYYRSDGTMIWTDLVVSLIRDQDGAPCYMVAMLEDTTERHQLHARLRHQALHDPLTELPNRTLFFERLDKALANKTTENRVGLCYLDVDGFKAINDTLGHDIGDRLLRSIGDRLAQRLGGQHLVARMGGDEFVVLVEDYDGPDDVIAVAQEALAAVREPLQVAAQSLSMSASVGVVDASASQTSAAELMKAADTTLYWAKSGGRNQWAFFDPERHAKEIARYELSTSLPAALDRGELFIEYQPLVRLRDDALIGVEALVRWQHPTWGRLGPDEFIGLAEESGLISPLGLWVLRSGCQQARQWRDKFPDRQVTISINLAPYQVKDPGIVADVTRLLAETGVEPQTVQLEITESAIMATSGQPLKTLHELADMGLQIAIDDFGTGYSNLAYLRTLPVHSLKLAGPFVTSLQRNAAAAGADGAAADGADGAAAAGAGAARAGAARADAQDRAIVGTLISLAHTLGLTVTAEGVETEGQVDALRALGCDTAQGYHYAPPGPADAIDAWLASGDALRVDHGGAA